MKNKNLRLPALALCLSLTLLSALCACGEETHEDRGHESLLEENLHNYRYRLLCTSERNADAVYASGMTGEVVNDAVFEKLCVVEEMFNCSVELASAVTAGTAEGIGRSILAGQDDFDLCMTAEADMASMSCKGYFTDLYDVPGMNLSEPWYITDGFALGNQMFLFSGDISYYGMSETGVLFFNKVLFDDYEMEYPYEDVKNHTWTLQKLWKLVRESYFDLDGDGQMSDRGDIFGFVSGGDYDGIAESLGLEPFQISGDGVITYAPDTDAYAKAAESVYSLVFGHGGWLCDDTDAARFQFRNAHAFFCFDKFSAAALSFSGGSLNAVKWGTLPMPLIEESQKQYYGVSRDCPAAIPITAAQHLETTGRITEALAKTGREIVYPVYYELAMKARYSTDEIDAEMVDLIMSNRRYSFSHLYGLGKDLNSILFPTLLDPLAPSADVSSLIEEQRGIQEALAQTVMDTFRAIREANT